MDDDQKINPDSNTVFFAGAVLKLFYVAAALMLGLLFGTIIGVIIDKVLTFIHS